MKDDLSGYSFVFSGTSMTIIKQITGTIQFIHGYIFICVKMERGRYIGGSNILKI